jgi:methyl-accepting chemotaxis protein
MFKIRSIAARLILAISLTVALACAILGTFSIMQQRALTRAGARAAAQAAI